MADGAGQRIRRIRAGDVEAFGDLLGRTEGRILALAWRMLGGMPPQSAAKQFVRLYRAQDFPNSWVRVGELVSGRPFADPTVFRYDGMWWMFVGNGASDSDPLAGASRTAAVTLTGGQTNLTVDAGFYLPASLAGSVFIDANGNGAAEAADTNTIAGVSVLLFDAASNVVATAVTSAQGAYLFSGLAPGAYTATSSTDSSATAAMPARSMSFIVNTRTPDACTISRSR